MRKRKDIPQEETELIAVIDKAFEDCEAPSQKVYSKDIADSVLKWLKRNTETQSIEPLVIKIQNHCGSLIPTFSIRKDSLND